MSDPAAPPAKPSRLRRILRRVVLVTGALMVCGVIAGYWAMDHLGHPLIKGRVQAFARDLLGADLDYEAGTIGLSGMQLQGLRIRNTPADDALVGDLLRVATIQIRWNAQRLAAGDRHLDALEIHDVSLGVVAGGDGGWSGARALTLPAPATPTEPTRPSQFWAALEAARGVDVARYELGPTTVTASAAAFPGSRAALTLPTVTGHVDVTGPSLRALLRVDGRAAMTLTPGETAMAAIAPTLARVQAELPGWVMPAAPWTFAAQFGLRLEPVPAPADAGPDAAPSLRLVTTLDPDAGADPAGVGPDDGRAGAVAAGALRAPQARGRWLDLELDVRPAPAVATTDIVLRRCRLAGGLAAADAAVQLQDAQAIDTLPAAKLQSAHARLDSGDRSWDATVANIAAQLAPGAKASATVAAMALAAPWQANIEATITLPAASLQTLPSQGNAQATAGLAGLNGSLMLAFDGRDLETTVQGELERLQAGVATGHIALEGARAKVLGTVPIALLQGGGAPTQLASSPIVSGSVRKLQVQAVDMPAAVTALDASLTLTIDADLQGAAMDVAAAELEASGPDGAWLQGSTLRMKLGASGARIDRLDASKLGLESVSLHANAASLRGGAGLTAGLRDAAFALTMETTELQLGADGSMRSDAIRLSCDAKELRAAGKERAATLHADTTITDLSVAFSRAFAARLHSASKLRAPGLDASLVLDKDDDLTWDAKIDVPAVRNLAQSIGVELPRPLRLQAAHGQSKGKLRQFDAALAALADGTSANLLATALPQLHVQHTGDVSLLGAGWSQADLRVGARRWTMNTQGGGTGLAQTHRFETTIEGGRHGDAALPTLTAHGDVHTTADARHPSRLRAGSIEGSGAVDGKERATLRLSVERGAAWRVVGAASVRKLGRFATQLLQELPCPDPAKLSAEGSIDLTMHAPGNGELAPLLTWLATPARWNIEGKGDAAIRGIACHLNGTSAAPSDSAPPATDVPSNAPAGAGGKTLGAGGTTLDAAIPEVKGDATFVLRQGKAEATVHATMHRLRGAFGAHPFDVRRASADATFRAPIAANLRGSSLQATFAIGELRQDILPTWRVADTTGELRVAVDNRGRIELERLQLQNPAGGSTARVDGIIDRIGDTSVFGLGDASGVPGSRGIALQGEFSQDLGALGALFGVRMAGKVSMPVQIESGDLTVFGVQARAKLEGVEIRHDALRISASEISGEIPLAIELVVDSQGVRPLGGGRRSAWSRWRFADHHPFMSGDHFVSIGKLRWRDETFGPLAGNARFDHDVFRIDQLELRVLSGQVTGSCVVELDGAATKVLLRGNATDIRLPGHPGRLDANAALEIEPWKFSIAGRAQLLRITTAHLRAMLDAFDPYREDVQANRARMALHLGRPEQVRLRFRHGFVDLWLQLGGLAEVVSIDEIRGVPLGPLMTQWLEPLLGDPPP